VLDGEAVSVRTFQQVSIPLERRLEIAEELRKHFADADASARNALDKEAEEIITEAMRSVRPGYRSYP
jgi:hypothetical protein